MAEEPKFKKPKLDEDEEDENTESKSKFFVCFHIIRCICAQACPQALKLVLYLSEIKALLKCGGSFKIRDRHDAMKDLLFFYFH